MAFTPKTSDAHKALVATLLDNDPELKALAREFTVRGMQEVINQLTRGDARTRADIAKSLASTMTKAITEVDGDDADASLREEMHSMIEEMRQGIMDDEAEDDEDAPRVVVAKRLLP